MADHIFVDTNPLIYILDYLSPFHAKTNSFFEKCIINDSEFYTSTITDAEFIVKPLMEHQFDKISMYHDFLNNFGFLKCFINEPIASRSAQIRVKYNGIKLADSLQLAAAIESECNIFLTNDKQLRQIEEIKVLLVDDL